jgi:hypothetical protein
MPEGDRLLQTGASALRSLWALPRPEAQDRLFSEAAFRQTPTKLDSLRFRVYVRNDLLPTFSSIRYGS